MEAVEHQRRLGLQRGSQGGDMAEAVERQRQLGLQAKSLACVPSTLLPPLLGGRGPQAASACASSVHARGVTTLCCRCSHRRCRCSHRRAATAAAPRAPDGQPSGALAVTLRTGAAFEGPS